MVAGITRLGRDDLSRVLGGGARIVGVDEVARALSVGRADAAKKLARWASAGWLRRVRRGLYIPVPVEAGDPAAWSEDVLFVADTVWKPCYFSGWTAASHWGFTDQVFRTTVVRTVQRVRASHQMLLDHEYLVSHVQAGRMWGLSAVWHLDRRMSMADPARTVVDILDDPSLGGGIRHGGDILVAYLAEHDGNNLVEYAERLGNGTVFKRLGYLVRTLAPDRVELQRKCAARLPTGVSLLEPRGPGEGALDGAWGLRVNVRVSPGDSS